MKIHRCIQSLSDWERCIVDTDGGTARDDTNVAGEVIDIHPDFKNEDFYHVFWLNEEWDGYVPKSVITSVEGDGFLHGTIIDGDVFGLSYFTGGKENPLLGEAKGEIRLLF